MDDLDDVRDLVTRRAVAQAEFDAADSALREAIRQAIGAGATAPALAAVTGLSKQRIYQIRDNTR
jgi:hypothetical protein